MDIYRRIWECYNIHANESVFYPDDRKVHFAA